MESLDFDSSLRLAHCLGIDPLDAYRYHMFQLITTDISDMANIFLILAELHSIIQDDKNIFKALLVNKSFRQVFDDHIIFITACRYGYTDIVQTLLKRKNIDPSFNSNCAFLMACENGNSETVKVLLEDPRIDPAAKNNEAIRFASIYGDATIYHLLIKDPRVSNFPEYPIPIKIIK
jgi:hypothetical protein